MSSKDLISFTIFWIFLIELSSSSTTVSYTDLLHQPTQNLTCGFESDSLCGWRKTGRSLDWSISDGSQFGGLADHTLGTKKGHFLTTTGKVHVAGDADLIGPKFAHGPHCLELFVKTPHLDSSYVTIYKVIRNLVVLLYRSRGKLFSDWEKLHLSLVSPQPYSIMIRSHQTNGLVGQIFVDDIKVMDGRCPLKPLSYVNVTCDFEDSDRMCGFKPDTVDNNHDWLLSNESLRLPWKKMQKISDHSLGTSEGHFLFSQLYSNGTNVTTAAIRSPVYKGTGTHCLSFYYLMLSNDPKLTKDIGTLRLYLVTEGNKVNSTVHGTWTKGNGKEWILVHVQFDIETDYRVVFESTATHSQTVYGVDDVTIRDRSCPVPTTTTQTTTPQPTTITTTTTTTTTTTATSTTTPTTPTTPTTTTSTTTPTTPTTTTTTTSTTTPTTPTTTISTTSAEKTTTSTLYNNDNIATAQIGKQTTENKDDTWMIALGAGAALVALIAVVVIFVTRRRRRNRSADEKNPANMEIQDRGSSKEYKSIAFSNPLAEISMENQGEAYA